jgi:WD40 repeat protein
VPRPSLAVDHGATALRRAVAGDLDTICSMALRKEPTRRYASVKQLCEDVQRHLDAQPVLARADTMTYRVSKFVRRNRVLVGSTLAIMAALVVGLATSTSLYLKSESARSLAEKRLDDAEHFAYQAAIRGAYTALQSGNPLPDMNSQPFERRGWEWKHLTARNDCTKRVVWRTPGPTPIALGGAGSLLAVSERAEVVLVDLDADAEHARIAVHGEPFRLALSPNGAWLASAVGAELQMYDTTTGKLAWSNATPNRIDSLVFTPDGAQILSGHLGGALRATAVECPEQSMELVRAKGMVRAISISKDGSLVALCGGLSDVLVLSLSDHRTLDRYTHPNNPQYLTGVAFLANGRYVASVDNNGRTAVWDRTTHEPLPSTADNLQYCPSLAVRPDKDELVIIGNHIRVWSLSTGTSRTLPGVHVSMRGLAMHPTRPLAYTTCDDGRVHEWDVSSEQVPVLPIRAESDAIAVSPDGRLCALRSHSGVLVRVWNSESGAVVESEHFKPDIARAVAFTPKGDRVVIGRSDGLHLLDAETLASQERLPLANPQLFTAPSIDGVAFVALKDGSITRVDLERLQTLDTRAGPLDGMSAVASDRSGAWFAAASTKDSSVALTRWNSGDWREFGGPSTSHALSLAFSPDARWIALGGDFVRVYAVETGELLFSQPTELVKSIAFTRDGDRLLAPAGAHLLVIHTGRWSVLATFKDNNRGIRALAYCPVTDSVFASDVTRDIRHFRAVDAPRIDAVE